MKIHNDPLQAAAEMYKNMRAAQPQETEEAQPEEEVVQPEEDLNESEDQETEEVETDEAEEAEESDEDEEDAELYEVKHNGETQKVSFDELTRLASAGFDYTKKTQELADKVRSETDRKVKEETADLEVKRQDLIQTTELLQQFLNKPVATEEEMQKLLEEGDTEGYLRLERQEKQRQVLMSETQKKRDEAVKEQQEQQEKQWKAYLNEQAQVLQQRMPELNNDDAKKDLLGYAKKVGYSEQEIAYAADARALEVLEKARRYDELQGKGVKPKPKSKSAKPIKKTSKNTPKATKESKAIQAQRARLSKSGSQKDAAELVKMLYKK